MTFCKDDLARGIIGAVILIGFGAYVWELTFEGGKVADNIAIYILGILSAQVVQVVAFYFGSSSGSANKSQQIANLTGQKGQGT